MLTLLITIKTFKVVQLVDIKCFKQRLKWRERCLAHRDWKARSYGALRKNIEKCFGIFASEQGSNEFSLSLFKQIVETIIQVN